MECLVRRSQICAFVSFKIYERNEGSSPIPITVPYSDFGSSWALTSAGPKTKTKRMRPNDQARGLQDVVDDADRRRRCLDKFLGIILKKEWRRGGFEIFLVIKPGFIRSECQRISTCLYFQTPIRVWTWQSVVSLQSGMPRCHVWAVRCATATWSHHETSSELGALCLNGWLVGRGEKLDNCWNEEVNLPLRGIWIETLESNPVLLNFTVPHISACSFLPLLFVPVCRLPSPFFAYFSGLLSVFTALRLGEACFKHSDDIAEKFHRLL